MSISKPMHSHKRIILIILAVLIALACGNIPQQGSEAAPQPTEQPATTEPTAQDDMQQLQEIDSHMNKADYGYVIQEMKIYLEKYPESYRGWNLLGWAYLKSDQLEQAEQSFDHSIEINAEWDNSYVGKGALYRKQGELDKASQSYQQAIGLLPENAEAYASLLVIELMRGNDEKAVEYGEKAWAIRQDLPTIPANLSIAYHYVGDEAKRDEYYGYAEELGYHDLEALKDIFAGKKSIR